NESADAFLFPGYLPLLLALAAILGFSARGSAGRASRSETDLRNATVFYGFLTLFSLWLSIGPPLGLWPLVYWLPGFNFIRVPARFTLLAMLGLAVVAGSGFERLFAGFTTPKRAVAAIIAGALLVAEFAAIPVATAPYRVEIPEIDRWLDGQPKPFA